MAFVINSTEIFNTNGGEQLPSTGVISRFVYHTQEKGLTIANDMKYKASLDAESTWGNIYITHVSSGGTKTELPNAIYITLDSDLMSKVNVDLQNEYNAQMQNPIVQYLYSIFGDIFLKTMVGQHLMLKYELENILGPDTVEIRLDLI